MPESSRRAEKVFPVKRASRYRGGGCGGGAGGGGFGGGGAGGGGGGPSGGIIFEWTLPLGVGGDTHSPESTLQRLSTSRWPSTVMVRRNMRKSSRAQTENHPVVSPAAWIKIIDEGFGEHFGTNIFLSVTPQAPRIGHAQYYRRQFALLPAIALKMPSSIKPGGKPMDTIFVDSPGI